MNVRDLFDRLATGPLSNLDLSDERTGSIEKEYWKKLINYTNGGLLKLFSRFILREKDVLIESKAHITKYVLDSKHSLSKGTDKDIYIMDFCSDPFEDDALKILSVHDQFGKKYVLNDPNRYDSLYTPRPITLQIPLPIEGKIFSLTYQARHDKLMYLPEEETKMMDQEISIPYFLEEPLSNYIASEYYSHLNGQENTLKGQEFFAKFDASCIEIEENDLTNETYSATSVKFYERGFR